MIYLILIFGFIFRLVSLNQSLWLDEATTALVAQMSFVDFFTKFMPADFHPPLYYLIISLWSAVFGYSEISLRIPSIIFGILTIYVVYLIAKETKIKWPITSALFLATSGLHIYYSQEARMYAMVTFLVSLLVFSYLKNNWMLFSVLLPLIFLTDYLSLLIYPALLIYTFFQNRKNIKKFLISLIPLIFVFLFWSPNFYIQFLSGLAVKENASNWWNILGQVSFDNIFLIPIKFILGRISFDNGIFYASIIFLISIPFVYLIISARNKLIWSWLVFPLIFGISISFFIPTLTYFRYLFILPAFYLLVSETKNIFLILIVLIINLATSSYYLLNDKFHRENWRKISEIVKDEKIVFPVNSQKEALIYYGKGSQIISKEQLTDIDNEFWLSRYVWNVFDPNDNTRKYIEDLGYNMIQESNLNGVVFWKYSKQVR